MKWWIWTLGNAYFSLGNKKHVFFSSLDWSAVESGALSGSIQPRSFENISVTSIDSVFSHTSDKQSFMSSKIEESFAELEYNLTL